MKIILAEPRGFCAGVSRAIEIVERAIIKYGAPVYVRHEIVHNRYVVEDLKNKGAVFVKEVSDIPDGAITIFSAHGVSDAVVESADIRKLPVIDATCPLVTKVHKEAKRAERKSREIILIGHAGHPEVEGTSGRVEQEVHLIQNIEDIEKLNVKNPDMLSYVTQTTLSVRDTKAIIEALKKHFPAIEGPDTKDICYATQNRQDAVVQLSKEVTIMLVIGAQNSSNSNRLRDLAEEKGIQSYLINGKEDININWFNQDDIVGITAGASAPEILVENVVEYLRDNFNAEISLQNGISENIKFNLPKELNDYKQKA